MDTIFTDGQLTKLIETMRQKQMTPERFNLVLGSGILADILDPNANLDNRDAVRLALKLDAVMPEIFHLTVDYSQTLEQMITAGHYNWTNSDITAKRFPIEGKGIAKYEARYFVFDGISSKNAVEKIKRADKDNPWMPAKIEHLLSHGVTFPEEQRKFQVVGLGSVAKVRGDRSVPCLDRGDSERDLNLSWWYYGWYPDYRFLAVRKVSVS